MISVKVLVLCFAVVAMVTAGTARAANPVVLIETNMGNIKVELFEEKAPITVKNFLDYVADKHYDDTVFHRVIDGFMIQGGGMDAKGGEKKTKPSIKNESANGLLNKKYSIAMARTSEPDSATSQFYINVADNTFLDRANARDKVGYCVFGQVIEGADVVDKIAKVKTGARDVPVETVLIKSVRRVDAKK